MSYKYSFADNEVYSADDVNKITKRLVTSGIADSFVDGVAYNVSKFNEAGKLLYTSGVVPESCLTMRVAKVNEGTVIINPGTAFFEDGSVIEIEPGGETLKYTKGAVNYVYLKNDLESTNTSYPCCSTDEPRGDYVMLATISENGIVKDERRYAHGKLPGYQSVGGNVLFISESVPLTITENRYACGEITLDISGNSYEYIGCFSFADEREGEANLSFYRISDGQILSFFRKSDADGIFENERMCVYTKDARSRIYAKPVLENGNLKLELEALWFQDSIGEVGNTYTFELNLFLI